MEVVIEGSKMHWQGLGLIYCNCRGRKVREVGHLGRLLEEES